MSRHVTTTENVRLAWSVWSLSTEDENGFDRWLAEVERAAAERAWWEGQRAGWEECADPCAFVNDVPAATTPNPYRKEAA